MPSVLAPFVASAALTALLLPVARRLAMRFGVVSGGGGRHVGPRKPALGGLALLVSTLVPIALAAGWFASAQALAGLVGGAVGMAAVGLIDDWRMLPPALKLGAQLALGAAAFGCGFRVDVLALPFGGEVALGAWALPITLLWIVGVTNAVNLIDGLDGLAGGVVLLAALTNLLVALIAGAPLAAVVMATLVGAMAVFLLHNYAPARIVMGNGGSYLLGYLLAVTALAGASGTGKTTTAVSLVVPLVALGVPAFDTCFAMARRLGRRRSPLVADREHVHHLLLSLGLTTRRAVFILHALSFVFSAAAIGIYLGRSWQVGLALFAVSGAVMTLVQLVRAARARRLRAPSRPQPHG